MLISALCIETSLDSLWRPTWPLNVSLEAFWASIPPGPILFISPIFSHIFKMLTLFRVILSALTNHFPIALI